VVGFASCELIYVNGQTYIKHLALKGMTELFGLMYIFEQTVMRIGCQKLENTGNLIFFSSDGVFSSKVFSANIYLLFS
jgi:hypothetical protein